MKQFLDEHEATNKVRMLRSQCREAILIVEGPNDERFYKRHVRRACRFVIAHGMDPLEKALRLLDGQHFQGVLAIRDADFGWHEGLVPWSPNLLWTDFHDLDVLLLASDACDKVLAELASREKLEGYRALSGFELSAMILPGVVLLGFLRWHSLKMPLNLRFENLDFERFVDAESLTVDAAQMILDVKNKSSQHALDGMELRATIEALALTTHDPRQVSCGPDGLEFLSVALRKGVAAKDRKSVDSEALQRYLRLAYHDPDFERTQLHAAMTDWSNRNPNYPLLPSRN